MKKKTRRTLPPLSAAVRKIRETGAYTQEGFARAVNLAAMTISRFETGRQVPTDPNVLARLLQAARDAGLPSEEALFNEALAEYEWDDNRGWTRSTVSAPSTMRTELRVDEWRLMQASRALIRIKPGRAAELERFLNDAAGAVDLVDEILRTVDAAQVASGNIWRDLEKKVSALADQRALEQLQRGK